MNKLKVIGPEGMGSMERFAFSQSCVLLKHFINQVVSLWIRKRGKLALILWKRLDNSLDVYTKPEPILNTWQTLC